MNLIDKINNRLNLEDNQDVMTMLDISQSPRRFDDVNELENYLSEGALLNITRIGSKALSMPSGDYMVWVTDAGHTMLVPVQEAVKASEEVFEQKDHEYDILTKDLLNHWNKVEKVLAEAEEENKYVSDKSNSNSEIRASIDTDTVDRMPILRAMEDRGFTVTSLASEVGVDPPAISRILRTPKDVPGDPKGRNPSMGLASQICKALRIDPTAAFPDIFGPQADYKPRKSPGNRGSGMANAAAGSTRKGKASKSWTQGSSSFAEGLYDTPSSNQSLNNTELSMKANETTNDAKIANDLTRDMKQQQDKDKAEQQQRERLLRPQLKTIDSTMNKMSKMADQGQQDLKSGNTRYNNLDLELDKVNDLLGNLQNSVL